MLGNIFNVFSRRKENQSVPRKPLTAEFRQRTLMLLRDAGDGSLHETLEYLHGKLAYLVGRVPLSQKNVNSVTEDAIEFLRTCSDAHFLDAVEYILHTDSHPCLRGQQNEVVGRLNEFMSIDDLPYFITKQVWESRESEDFRLRSSWIIEESKVIPKDSQVIHEMAFEPALQLLRQPAFRHANTEFMAALEDFRHHKFGDCVTKCNASYESVMKVICGQKGFEYSQGDTTSRLLKSIMGKTQMDSFWESPLLIVGTLRNKLGSAHGAGENAKVVPEHVARYTLNMTASAIVFLHDQAYKGK
ncbi:abortive infection family protein [Pseudomonas putida]|uniref:abortive infection family protein n=1 Tax=Pseudomonas putida TaxID=303 RepID=UPI000B0EEF7A|nr:abortive infection family protein [Pseudomonas putida]